MLKHTGHHGSHTPSKSVWEGQYWFLKNDIRPHQTVSESLSINERQRPMSLLDALTLFHHLEMNVACRILDSRVWRSTLSPTGKQIGVC